jgi:hypothetical protein
MHVVLKVEDNSRAGNTEEDNFNGYVVFELNSHGLAGKYGGGLRGVSPPIPHPFPLQASGQIFKDDVNWFSPNSEIFFFSSFYFGVFTLLRKEKKGFLVFDSPVSH